MSKSLLGPVLLALWCGLANVASASSLFPLVPRLYSTGDAQSDVDTADLNGDGVLDLIVVTPGQLAVSVFMAQEGGAFVESARYQLTWSIGQSLFDLTLSDVDRDGRIDILVTRERDANGSVVVLRGLGEGEFAGPILSDAGNQGRLAAADFDADGYPDIAVTDPTAKAIDIALGQRDGTFALTASIPLPDIPGHVVAGDLDSDGDIDLLIGLENTSSVAMVAGNGGGAFGDPVSIPIGGIAGKILLSDLDEDGRTDALIAHQDPPGVGIYEGMGNGRIRSVGSYPESATPIGLSLTDVDRDGEPDLLVCISTGHVTTRTRQRPLSFGPGTTAWVFQSPVAFLTGNFDRDPYVDLAATQGRDFDASLAVVRGRHDGGFWLTPRYSAYGLPAAVLPLDIDRDGLLDLVCPSRWSDNIAVLRGLPHGTFGVPIAVDLPGDPWDVASLDVNGDDIPDIAVTQSGQARIALMLGTPDGSFVYDRQVVSCERPGPIVAADLNADGLTDLVTASLEGDDVAVMFGRGGHDFEPPLLLPMETFIVYEDGIRLAVEDLDADGILDIVATTSWSGRVLIYRGLGNGVFGEHDTYRVHKPTMDVAVGDLSGDGIPDLVVVTGIIGQSVAVIRGVGGGVFDEEDIEDVDVSLFVERVALGDLDRDGHLDVVAGSLTGTAVLRGFPGGALAEPQLYRASGADGVTVADFNGDGAPDIAAVSALGGSAYILAGRQRPQFEFGSGPTLTLEQTGTVSAVPGAGPNPAARPSTSASSVPMIPESRLRIDPNPVLDGAQVSFTLPREGTVRVTLHDAAGRQVSSLVEGVVSKGTHVIDWWEITGQVPAGAYFLRVDTGTTHEVKRVVVLR